MTDHPMVPAEDSETDLALDSAIEPAHDLAPDPAPALNRAARRARGKGERQPLPPHLGSRIGRNTPVPRRTGFAARRSG